MKTWFTITNKADAPAAEIDIFGDLGDFDVSLSSFAAELKKIPMDRDITLRINSRGGDVDQGFGIFDLIEERRARVTARIVGLAASMATIIVLAAKKVTASRNSILMVHNPVAVVGGNSADLRKTATDLDKYTDRLVAAYVEKTKKTDAVVRAAMNAVTYFTAAEAKEWGIVDEILSNEKVSAKLDLSCFGAVPDRIKTVIDTQEISGGAQNAPTNNQPKQGPDIMKNLLKALVDARLIASADASEDTAVAQFTANFATIQSNAAAAATENAELKKKVDAQEAQAKADLKARAESAIASAVSTGRIKDEASLRAKWVDAYERDEDGAKAMLAALPEPKAPRGAAPVVTTPPAGAKTDEQQLTGRARAAAVWNAQFTKN